MDGLRLRLIMNYNSLVRKLNKSKYRHGEIVIDDIEIANELEGIRNGLVTLAFCYMDGPDGFSELPEDTQFEEFNY